MNMSMLNGMAWQTFHCSRCTCRFLKLKWYHSLPEIVPSSHRPAPRRLQARSGLVVYAARGASCQEVQQLQQQGYTYVDGEYSPIARRRGVPLPPSPSLPPSPPPLPPPTRLPPNLPSSFTSSSPVRTIAEYNQGHVPGALSLPSLSMSPSGWELSATFIDDFQRRFADKGAKIIVGKLFFLYSSFLPTFL
jgi:hypothetical protein